MALRAGADVGGVGADLRKRWNTDSTSLNRFDLRANRFVDEAARRGLYSAVALMVMLTTFLAPPLLRRMLVPGEAPKRDDYDLVVNAPMDLDDD